MIETIERSNMRVTPRLTAASSLIGGDTYRRFMLNRAARTHEYGWQVNFDGSVRELMHRATFSGIITSTDHRGPLGGGPGRSVYLQDLLQQGTTKSSSVIYARENANWTNAAEAVAENDDRAEQSDFNLDEVTARVAMAAVFMKTTEETFADYQNLESFISGQLVRRIKLKIESLILNSNGISPNHIIGFQEVGLPTVSITTAGSLLEAIDESIAQIESNGYTPSFVALNPTDKRALYSGSTASPLLIWDGSVLRLHGVPILGSTAVTVGTGLIGDGGQAAILYHSGIGGSAYRKEKTNSNEDDFLANLITLRAGARAALVIQSLGAFVEITA